MNAEDGLKIYPVSLAATIVKPGRCFTNHAAALVRASSEDEALGKALRMNQALHPAAEGWTSQDVAVGSPVPGDPNEVRKSATEGMMDMIRRAS